MEQDIRITLPPKGKHIIETLRQAGFEAYAVGGCVRDSILGREPQDWDITTSAPPERVKALFPRTIDTGLQHGTVTVMLQGEGFEVTTYRIDGAYEDSRHPSQVTFTGELGEDLRRRDLTINAMAYNDEAGLVDLFGGMADLEAGVVRCVGDPRERFREDALRILRAIRFAAQLGYGIERETAAAMEELAPSLCRISAERIQVELVKLLVSPHPDFLRIAYDIGVTKVFLPELDKACETPQNHPHHCYSVGEHILKSLEHVEPDKVLRLTMLFHDVAKPVCKSQDENGIYHFYGHPNLGARIAREILRRLRFDNDTTDRVTALITWHDHRPQLKEAAVRRTIHRVGLRQYPDLFEVKQADTLAKNRYKRKEKLDYLEEYRRIYQEILDRNQCLTLKDLAVDVLKLDSYTEPAEKDWETGDIELAPILGLSDVIVDIVETGMTLLENDLEPKETIVPISARLIANKVGYKFKHQQITELCRRMETLPEKG